MNVNDAALLAVSSVTPELQLTPSFVMEPTYRFRSALGVPPYASFTKLTLSVCEPVPKLPAKEKYSQFPLL